MPPPEGVTFTHLDEPLFDGSGAAKRDLVDYLEAVAERILPELADRPLTVVRVHRGEEPFMQKNLPSYAPSFIPTVRFWAETSKREVSYPVCNDLRTLLWFANQRAVEYHPALTLASRPDHMTHLVVDLDPPSAEAFGLAVQTARLVREALAASALRGAVKTSGAKGLHVVVPIADDCSIPDAAAATRAIAMRAEALDPGLATTEFVKAERGSRVFVDSTRAGAATVVAAYSPRVRRGVPVSFPVSWDVLDDVSPADFTMSTVPDLLAGGEDPWADEMPPPQRLPGDLVEEGHAIPIARVRAMHEGRRRARDRPG
jgi:DNA ligase D